MTGTGALGSAEPYGVLDTGTVEAKVAKHPIIQRVHLCHGTADAVAIVRISRIPQEASTAAPAARTSCAECSISRLDMTGRHLTSG